MVTTSPTASPFSLVTTFNKLILKLLSQSPFLLNILYSMADSIHALYSVSCRCVEGVHPNVRWSRSASGELLPPANNSNTNNSAPDENLQALSAPAALSGAPPSLQSKRRRRDVFMWPPSRRLHVERKAKQQEAE